MTTRQLAWGIAIWPFVFVLEFIGQAHLVGYDWDMSTASVLALIGGYAAVALLIATLIWLPAGVLLSRLLEGRSRAMQGLGFGALGVALGVVVAMVLAGVYVNSIMSNNYVYTAGDFNGLGVMLLETTAMFVIPSVLGWMFAAAVTTRSGDRWRWSGRLVQQASR